VLETEKSFLQFHEAGLQKVAANYLFPAAWLIPAKVAEKGLERDVFGFNCGLTSLVGADNYEILGKRITHIRPLLTLVDSHPFTGTSVIIYHILYIPMSLSCPKYDYLPF
jgi:hypothetical protein